MAARTETAVTPDEAAILKEMGSFEDLEPASGTNTGTDKTIEPIEEYSSDKAVGEGLSEEGIPGDASGSISSGSSDENSEAEPEAEPFGAVTTDPVKHILIEGNSTVKTEDLMKFITHTKLDEPYDREAVKKDLQDIAGSGVVQSAKAEAVQNNGELYVVFKITELSEIKSIQFAGNTLIETDALMERLVSRQGEIFSTDSVKQDIDNIKAAYNDAGYIAIVYDVNNDDGNVTYHIAEAKIADVRYEGNSKTREWVLDKITSRALKKGEFLTQKALQVAYNDLTATGFFSEVAITADEGSTPGDVILKVAVSEARTGQWHLGGAYSDTYKGEIVGGIGDKNLGGTAKSIDFDFGLGKDRNRFALTYRDPFYKRSDTSIYLQAFKTDKTIDNNNYEYDESHAGGEIGFSKPASRDKKTSFYGNFRFDKIGVSNQKRAPENSNELKDFQEGSITLGVAHDTRNEGQVSGSVFQGEVTAGMKWLGSDEDFTKFTARMKNYLKVSARDTLASRLELNYSPSELPGVEQFSIGGSESVRGLDEDAQRGDKSVLASLELRHDFNDKLQGVVFVDAGKAWSDEINNSLKVAAGLGIRVKTAMGILRLDAAKSGGDSIKYLFGIGQDF